MANRITRPGAGGAENSEFTGRKQGEGHENPQVPKHAPRGGAALSELAARLPRRAAIRIEATYAELSESVRDILGPDAFDESAFKERIRTIETVTTDVSGALENRVNKVNRWTWLKVDPRAGQSRQLVGHGTDHAVYVDPEHPGKVIKVSVATMSQLARWNMLFGRGESQRTPRGIVDQGRWVARNEARRYVRLATGFPEGAVPRQVTQIARMPVRGVILRYLLQNSVVPDRSRIPIDIDPQAAYHLWTLVRRQDFLPQFADPSLKDFSLSLHFIERVTDYPPQERYAAINDNWVLNRRSDFDQPGFRYCVEGTKLESLYDACQTDETLRESVRDFLSHGIDFMNETREVLDVGGDGNVIFSGGKYFLPDALTSPSFENGLDLAAKTLREIKGGRPVSEGDAWKLAFTLNIVRAMNAMAQALDLDKRVHLLPPDEESQPIAWERVLPRLRGQESKPEAAKPSERSLLSEPIVLPIVEHPWGVDARGGVA